MPKTKKTTKKRTESTILWFSDISIKDVELVGGKNASLGEMYSNLTKKGIKIPNGFAVTAAAYRQILAANDLDRFIKKTMAGLDVSNIKALSKAGKAIRAKLLKMSIPKEIEVEIAKAYKELSGKKKRGIAVAVRSSATAEDLPDASFAGQQETYLNVVGEKQLVDAVKKCMASLFTDRAISYRETKGFDHLSVALSVTVQEMVRSDVGASGVMFTLDTESGFGGVVLINAAYGLGEYVVKGRVTPDQYYVFKHGLKKGKRSIISRSVGSKEVKLVYGKSGGTKQLSVSQKERNTFVISDDDVLQLAKWGVQIEEYYGRAQDIEWAKDGRTGELYIVQARPETVKAHSDHAVIEHYSLKKKGKELLRGVSVGQKIGAGKARVIEKPSQMSGFKKGDVLVTRITDPDWEPIMRKASAIVTEQGGKTSHAAIVSRELGVPCVVGAKDARKKLKTGKAITVSCAEGDEGVIYSGILPFEVQRTEVKNMPETKTKIMMNVGDPDNAFALSFLPNDGIGLAREEFIFSNFIRIHPLALINYNKLADKKAKAQIKEMTRGYKKKTDFLVDRLAEGIARIAAAAYDRDVVLRLSDFKTNEYETLIGGKEFEPKEANPMIGWRGASRYYSKEYKEAFGLECAAIKKARDEWGLDNIVLMVPFCRTPEEGRKVLKTMEEFGLKKGENGLRVIVMCEIPSNVVLAEEFTELFDGFSIGSNDLTQLALGVDRDSALVSHVYNENDETVKTLIKEVIKVAHKKGKPVGICGQAPSDSPEFAEFLVEAGIDSISLNPDTVVATKKRIAEVEKTLGKKGKKTHKSYLGLVTAMGAIAALFITLGAGCANPLDQAGLTPKQTYEDVSPAQIRQKTEARLREMQEKEADEQMQTLREQSFAHFTVSYPAKWQVESWSGGVTMRGEDGAYVSIYEQLVSAQIPADQKTQTIISSASATQYVAGEVRVTEIEVDEDTTLVIEGSSEKYEQIVESFSLVDGQNALDGAPTHWDVREGRLCAQVITFARQTAEGQCEAFSTPCNVPEGWSVCDAGDVE